MKRLRAVRGAVEVAIAGDPGDVLDFRAWLLQHKKPGERLQAIADASPQIRSSADRAGRFLSLASMVSVLLAAIAVAMAARRYARRHLDNVALMKCMGASTCVPLCAPRESFDKVNPSPLRMSLRNSKDIGASPS